MQSPSQQPKLQEVLTVSQLTAQLRDVLEQEFQHVFVTGEVSNAKQQPSGHVYFSLKDREATLPCVCFRSTNSMLKFRIEDGISVVVRGKLTVYAPKGGYQLVVSSLEPVGIGDWQLAFEQLKTKLEREGLLEKSRKRLIPMVPRKVGVVTSPAGAAVRDVISAIFRRNQHVSIVIAPAKVQGEGSAEEVAYAISLLNTLKDIDVIIVARGGGSIEDLWAFNTEVVARAVASSSVPVISGVGHETDITICDLVADLRAPTPTAAAEMVAKGSAELIERFLNLKKHLINKTETNLLHARRKIERLRPTQVLMRYSERLKRDQLRITHCRTRLEQTIEYRLTKNQQILRHYHEKLQALAPTNVIQRGFAILKDEQGHLVTNAADVKAGAVLIAQLKTGQLRLRVMPAAHEKVDEDPPAEPRQMNLFE